MRTIAFILAAGLVLPFPVVGADPSPPTSLVYVATTSQFWKFAQPWDKDQPSRKRGLGTLIEGGMILVTGELVANATYVELERPGDGAKATARVVARDYECNLALLEPVSGDEDFLAGTVPLALDEGAARGDALEVWQLEDDGGAVITPGVFNRVEMGTYWLPDRSFLRFEFKGSIQNKAGSFIVPAVRDGKLAGIVLGYDADEQVADILPAFIIRRFLDDLADGDYAGFATMGIRYTRTTDDQFRRWLGLGDEMEGVFISSVVPGAAADLAGMKAGDVLMSLDGHAIDRRGYYDDPDFGSLNFGHIITGRHGVGETIEAVVLRDGEKTTLPVTLSRKVPEDHLVDPWMFDRGPRYLMMGGVLFTELSRPFIRSFKDWKKNAPVELVYIEENQQEFAEGREKVVILVYVIPTPATVGYESVRYAVVEEANGQPVGSIRDLHSALLRSIDGRHAIKLKGSHPVIYLDAGLAAEVDQRLEASGVSPLSRLD